MDFDSQLDRLIEDVIKAAATRKKPTMRTSKKEHVLRSAMTIVEKQGLAALTYESLAAETGLRIFERNRTLSFY